MLNTSLLTGLCEDELVIGNKSGRQIIRCRTIIDAIETAAIARLAGEAFEPPSEGPVRMTRTLEFARIEPIPDTSFPVPERFGLSAVLVLFNIVVERLYKGKRYAAVKRLDVAARILYPAVVLGMALFYVVKFG